jgi:hypothetical protein
MSIPKIIFQTSRIKNHLLTRYFTEEYPDYRYVYFDDKDAIEYFVNNSLEEFPSPQDQFKFLNKGAFRADFLRYYWLYINGGIYIDTDIEIVTSLNELISNNAFVGVITSNRKAFNGFIACEPQHPIIYDSLKHIYNCKTNINNYGYFCEYFYKAIYKCEKPKYILQEKFVPERKTNIIDPNTLDIKMTHHYSNKNRVYKILSKNMNNNAWDKLWKTQK